MTLIVNLYNPEAVIIILLEMIPVRVSGISSATYTPRTNGAFSARVAGKLDGTQALINESTVIQDILDIKSALTMPKIERAPDIKSLRSPFDEHPAEDDKDGDEDAGNTENMATRQFSAGQSHGNASNNRDAAGNPERKRGISAYALTNSLFEYNKVSAGIKHFDFST